MARCLEDAKTAGRMIHLLGEECRLFSQISAQQLISMADELRLCHMHLSIMSLRHERTYILHTSGSTKRRVYHPRSFIRWSKTPLRTVVMHRHRWAVAQWPSGHHFVLFHTQGTEGAISFTHFARSFRRLRCKLYPRGIPNLWP